MQNRDFVYKPVDNEDNHRLILYKNETFFKLKNDNMGVENLNEKFVWK